MFVGNHIEVAVICTRRWRAVAMRCMPRRFKQVERRIGVRVQALNCKSRTQTTLQLVDIGLRLVMCAVEKGIRRLRLSRATRDT